MKYTFNLPYINFAAGFHLEHDLIMKDFVNNLKSFLEKMTVPESSASAIAYALYHRMSDESLFYHTPIHILCMFQFAQENSISLSCAQQLAIWFHDSIYVPTAQNPENEINSSIFLHSMLSPFCNPIFEKMLEEAKDIIIATSLHLEKEIAENCSLVLDLDLCSFSFDYPIYDYVGSCIRKEYPNKSDSEVETGRKSFLKLLKEKGFIYRTEYFKKNFELKALENISKSLDKI